MARGLTTLPDEMINWIDHGKVIETMPTDDNSIQEMISGMPNGSLIIATQEQAQSEVIKLGVNVQQVLQGDLNFYIDTNGNDSNDGSQESPWKTINHALNYISRYTPTPSYYSIWIHIGNGTFNELVTFPVGSFRGNLVLQGNGVDNTIINGSVYCNNNFGSTVFFSNLTIQSDVNNGNKGVTLHSATSKLILMDNIRLINTGDGSSTLGALNASEQGIIQNYGYLNLEIILNNSRCALDCWNRGNILFDGCSVNVNGNVYHATVLCSTQSLIVISNISGNVTGMRYHASMNSSIYTATGNEQFIPGTIDGVVISSSSYY